MVALVSDDSAYGGPLSVARMQCAELARRGAAVQLHGLWRGAGPAPTGADGVRERLAPARTWVPRSGLLGLCSARFLRTLWRALAGAEVCHVHAGRDLVSFFALLLALLRRTPVVAQTHGMVQPRTHLAARVFDAAYVPLLRRARSILWLTEEERAGLVQVLGEGAAGRLRYLGNGLPERSAAFEESDPPADTEPTVLFLSRINPSKRATAFVEMAAELRDRGVSARFVVHGPDDGALADVLAAIDRLELDGVCSYAGPVPPDRAAETVRGATVLVLPSVRDWFPMVLLEAMAERTAVVCTDESGLAAPIRRAGAGWVTDGSPVALAEAVREALTDPAGRRARVAAAAELIRTTYSASAVASELGRVYVRSTERSQNSA